MTGVVREAEGDPGVRVPAAEGWVDGSAEASPGELPGRYTRFTRAMALTATLLACAAVTLTVVR